jgi:hypothetical protein
MFRKRRKGSSSSSRANEEENEEVPQPVTRHKMVNLNRLKKIDPDEWPENTEEYLGLKLTREQKNHFLALQSRTIIASRYVDIPTMQELGILEQVQAFASSINI